LGTFLLNNIRMSKSFNYNSYLILCVVVFLLPYSFLKCNICLDLVTHLFLCLPFLFPSFWAPNQSSEANPVTILLIKIYWWHIPSSFGLLEHVFPFFLVGVVLEISSWALCMLGKCSIPELPPSPYFTYF
jgi:hypothetical protein